VGVTQVSVVAKMYYSTASGLKSKGVSKSQNAVRDRAKEELKNVVPVAGISFQKG